MAFPPDTRGKTGRAMIKRQQEVLHERIHAQHSRERRPEFTSNPRSEQAVDRSGTDAHRVREQARVFQEVRETYRRVAGAASGLSHNNSQVGLYEVSADRLSRNRGLGRQRAHQEERYRRAQQVLRRDPASSSNGTKSLTKTTPPRSYGLGKKLSEQRARALAATAPVDSHETTLLKLSKLHMVRERSRSGTGEGVHKPTPTSRARLRASDCGHVFTLGAGNSDHRCVSAGLYGPGDPL